MREGKAGKAGSAQEKLRHLAHPAGGAAGAKPRQLTFEIFFPRPGDTGTPYRGAHYRAARGKDGLFNFVGLVLGHGGSTVQRIQRLSGAKVEVRDSAGNLNGAHPSSHGDPSLHAWVAASSRQRLEKAVHLLLEVLAPTNTTLQPVVVLPGACAVLEPVVPGNGPEAAKQAAAERGHGPAGKAAGGKASTPPPPAVNAWASNRLLQQHGKDQQSAPPASPPTSPAAQQSEPAEQVFDRTDSDLSSAASGAGVDDDTAAAAVDPCKGFGGGLQSPASVVPPPPPPRHNQQEPQSPRLSSSAPSAAPAAEPATARAADTTGAATALAAQAGQAAPPVPMATVWAKGLHPQEGALETPATPSAAAERANPLAPERTATASSAGSWSLWDAGRSSTGSSFYEELQAAALGLGPQPATSQPSLLAPAAQRQLLHSNSWPQSHSQAERASQAALLRHNEALGLLPPPPHALASMAVPDQLAAPFPGLGRSASGLAQPLGSYSMPMLHSVVGAHSGLAGLAAGQPAGLPVVPPPSAGAHPYLGLAATAPLADLPSAAERELQQLLVALASMAAKERGSL